MDQAYASAPPAGRVVFLHVGAPKTGTTYLQQVLWKNREALAADGLCYPLERPVEHLHAALDLRQMPWGGRRDPAWDGAWERVANRVRGWRGPTAVLSNELLAGASERHAEQAVASLRPAEVHVVVTARDLARQLPSGWQEHLKHQHPVGFDDFLDDLIDSGTAGRYGRLFWSLHDVPEVLRRWRAAVPAERIHVVTAPQPGAPKRLLWRRFAGLVGLDAKRYDTDVTRDNTSVGAAEAELLYRINVALDRRLPARYYDRMVRQWLAETILARRPGATPIALPARRYPWVLERSKQVIADLSAGGYDVVGELDELLPPPPYEGDGPGEPGDTDAERMLDAAVDALAGLLLHDGPHGEQAPPQPPPAPEGRTPPSAVKRLVRDLSERHAPVMRARTMWWHTVERAQRFGFGR